MFKWWENYKTSKYLLKEAEEKEAKYHRMFLLNREFVELLKPVEKRSSLFFKPDLTDSDIVYNLKKIIREEVAAINTEKKRGKKNV